MITIIINVICWTIYRSAKSWILWVHLDEIVLILFTMLFFYKICGGDICFIKTQLRVCKASELIFWKCNNVLYFFLVSHKKFLWNSLKSVALMSPDFFKYQEVGIILQCLSTMCFLFSEFIFFAGTSQSQNPTGRRLPPALPAGQEVRLRPRSAAAAELSRGP